MKVKSLSLLAGLTPLIIALPYGLQDNIVSLDGYGKFKGVSINTSLTGQPLPQSVDAWLGIEYAQQPVGENRFKRIIGGPEKFFGVKNASTYGKVCIQDPTSISYPMDEACLNFNVYRTPGVPLSKKLPILLWIHGGSFVSGSGRSIDGASFVSYSKAPIMVVSFNYRLNSLGFLPSTIFEEEDLLNIGLTDQDYFLHFVQKHIAQFGGDPNAVTLGGRSAGSHSTGIHYFHNYGPEANTTLFSRAIMQSGSVTARAFPNATYPLYVRQFQEYMDYLKCPTNDNLAALACLRTVDISEIQYISSRIYSESEYSITWPFQPTLGGPLLEKPGSQSGIDGTFYKIPVISSTTTDEGRFYTPGNLSTNADFIGFLSNISPGLSQEELGELASLYPDPVTDPNSPYVNSPNSTQFSRIGAGYSDYAYICPGQETVTRTSLAGVPSWKVRFNTPNGTPIWQGVPHTSDVKYTWNAPDVQYPDVSPIYHSYLSSFVLTGNPNTYRAEGTPEWPPYDASVESTGERPLQIVVNPNGTVVEKDTIRSKQCAWWREPARQLRLNK